MTFLTVPMTHLPSPDTSISSFRQPASSSGYVHLMVSASDFAQTLLPHGKQMDHDERVSNEN